MSKTVVLLAVALATAATSHKAVWAHSRSADDNASSASHILVQSGSEKDRQAILAIIDRGYIDNDNPGVSPNLDWENDFGVRYAALDKLKSFYNRRVTPLSTKSFENTTLEVKFRFVQPDLAIVDRYWHVAGQLDPNDSTKMGPDRWGRTTFVFSEQGGTWVETMERIADLRSPYYKHYTTFPAAFPLTTRALPERRESVGVPRGVRV